MARLFPERECRFSCRPTLVVLLPLLKERPPPIITRVLFGDRELNFFPGSESSSPKEVINLIPPSKGEGERDLDTDLERRSFPS